MSSPAPLSLEGQSTTIALAQLTGPRTRTVNGRVSSHIREDVYSAIEELKGRLSMLDGAASSGASEKAVHGAIAADVLRVEAVLGASRQFHKAIVRNDVERVRR